MKVSAASSIDKIELGGNVTETGAVIAGDAETKHVKPITFKDQDGNAFIPSTLDSKFTVKTPEGAAFKAANATLEYYTINDKGEVVVNIGLKFPKNIGIKFLTFLF